MWRKHPALAVRSGGTSPSARHAVSAADLAWADVILVMEEKHKDRLKAGFGRVLSNKSIFVLDIPDEYRFMDPELVEQLQSSVGSILGIDAKS